METLIEVNKREQDWVIIFEFAWELDETNADKTFASVYESIWDFNSIKIVFNFVWLKYLNSKSIWYIADVFSNIEENNWKMCICECREWVKDVLELVWITTIVPTVVTIQEAIDSVNQ